MGEVEGGLLNNSFQVWNNNLHTLKNCFCYRVIKTLYDTLPSKADRKALFTSVDKSHWNPSYSYARTFSNRLLCCLNRPEIGIYTIYSKINCRLHRPFARYMSFINRKLLEKSLSQKNTQQHYRKRFLLLVFFNTSVKEVPFCNHLLFLFAGCYPQSSNQPDRVFNGKHIKVAWRVACRTCLSQMVCVYVSLHSSGMCLAV